MFFPFCVFPSPFCRRSETKRNGTGELLPGAVVRCPLQLLALVAGLHELRGCTVADMHTAQEFPQGKLRDILVEFPDDEEEEEEEGAVEEVVVVAESGGGGGDGGAPVGL